MEDILIKLTVMFKTVLMLKRELFFKSVSSCKFNSMKYYDNCIIFIYYVKLPNAKKISCSEFLLEVKMIDVNLYHAYIVYISTCFNSH